MKRVYVIQDFDTKLFLDWYSGIFSLTEDVDGRNSQFNSYNEALKLLTDKILDIKADIDNLDRLQIIEILT